MFEKRSSAPGEPPPVEEIVRDAPSEINSSKKGEFMSRIIVCLVLLSILIAAGANAQVTVISQSGYCEVGTTCSFDVKVSAGAPLGRLAVVLHYNNAAITIVGIDDGHFMPTTQRLWFANDICTETTLCDPPASCGQVDYLGLDSGDATTGFGTIYTVHYTMHSTTQMLWSPCEAWCNSWICVSLTPYARSYDGTVNYSMYYNPGTLNSSLVPLVDTDGDGLIDLMELDLGTDPFDADSDDDGLLDGSDPTPESLLTVGGEDLDADGIIAPWETDPRDPDSDDDGLFDGTEVGLTAPLSPDTNLSAGSFVPDADPISTTDPLDSDSDDDGVLDGVEDANGNGAVDPGEADPSSGASVPTLETPVVGIKVFLLGDGDSTLQVQTALESAGHTVTVVDPYDSWDGITPAVDQFGVVVLLDGDDYGEDLVPEASTALAEFVNAGRGLIVTEWMAYDVCYDDKTGPIVDVMPVVAPDCDYDYDATWTVASTHELTQGLPASFTEGDEYFSIVDPTPGAIALMHDEDGVPLLTYSAQANGRVIHINNSLTYSSSEIDPNLLSIMVNAVGFANRGLLFADSFESGNTNTWSEVY